MKGWASRDSQFSTILSTHYKSLSADESIEETCRELGDARQAAIANLYSRVDTLSGEEYSCIHPLLNQISTTNYSKSSIAEQVRMSMEVELGMRASNGRLIPASRQRLPRAPDYGCIALVFSKIDIASGKIEYKLRNEYWQDIDDNQPIFVERSRMGSIRNVYCN